MCLLGFNGCSVPNYIIINSGFHDRKHPIKIFEKVIFTFLNDLVHRYKRDKLKVDIIWAGITLASKKWEVIAHLDQTAHKIMDILKIPFLNNTEILEYIPLYEQHHSMYTPDNIHFGSIAKMLDSNITGTVSMLKTQRILNEMCNHAIKDTINAPLPKTINVQIL